MLRIKICGVTNVEQAEWCMAAGADFIGLNFVAGSPRRIDRDAARAIAVATRGRVLVVGVVADQDEHTLRRLLEDVGLDRLQLHGDEPAELVRALAPSAFKAVRIGGAADIACAAELPGDMMLIDARVPGRLGGTGVRVDWSLVAPLAASRRILLAGGLTPDNVAEAVRMVRPFGVDVASGVESAPAIKDPHKVAAFVAAARAAYAAVSGSD